MDEGTTTAPTNASGTETTDANVEFGTWLRTKREAVRVPLEEIAAITKVHITQLRMIEENHWDSLPAPAFVRGFLLCYARHIGLDEDEVLRRYRKSLGKTDSSFLKVSPTENAGAERTRVIASPSFKSAPGARDLDKIRPPILTPKRVFGGIVILALIAFVYFLISIGQSDSKKVAVVTDRNKTAETPASTSNTVTKTETSPVPANSTATATTATAAAVENKTATTPNNAVPAPGPIVLTVKAIEQTWISVRADNQDAKGQLIKVGTKLSFQAENKMDLVFSNAGAVELEYKGKKYFPPGFRGDVVKMSLPGDAEKLKEKPAAARQVVKPAPAAPATPPASTELQL